MIWFYVPILIMSTLLGIYFSHPDDTPTVVVLNSILATIGAFAGIIFMTVIWILLTTNDVAPYIIVIGASQWILGFFLFKSLLAQK